MVQNSAYLISLFTFLFIIIFIRSAKIQIRDAIFWIVWSLFLYMIALLYPKWEHILHKWQVEASIIYIIALCALFTYLVIMFLSIRLSNQAKTIRQLTQMLAIFEHMHKKDQQRILKEIEYMKNQGKE